MLHSWTSLNLLQCIFAIHNLQVLCHLPDFSGVPLTLYCSGVARQETILKDPEYEFSYKVEMPFFRINSAIIYIKNKSFRGACHLVTKNLNPKAWISDCFIYFTCFCDIIEKSNSVVLLNNMAEYGLNNEFLSKMLLVSKKSYCTFNSFIFWQKKLQMLDECYSCIPL